jgi:hypothetical protein
MENVINLIEKNLLKTRWEKTIKLKDGTKDYPRKHTDD